MITNNFILISSAIFGACIGSFLNVCILRIPNDISIVFPPSSCPECQEPIKWYDNIPLFSYLILLGKCRNCKTKISFQYFLVELISAFFAFYSVLKFSLTLKAFFVFVFISALIVISFIDLKHKIIPDVISLPGIPFFLTASFFSMDINITDLFMGVLIGGGCLYLIAFFYKLATGKDGMGGGDIKLLAMIGAFTGYKGVFFTIFAASMMGTVIGFMVIMIKGKNMKYAVPFGPFLSAGALIFVFWGNAIINIYLNLLIN